MVVKASAAGGGWSVGANWAPAGVPGIGDTVTILNTHTIIIDQVIDVGNDTATAAIRINNGGKLQLVGGAGANYTLTLRGDMIVDNGGVFEVGTPLIPVPWGRTFIIYTNWSAAMVSGKYGITGDGTCMLQGWKPSLWMAKATATATALDDHIHVDNVGDWHVLDRIAIAPTNRPASGAACEDEVRIIDHFVGNAIYLTVPLTYTHTVVGVVVECEVINLTRNIVITSADPTKPGYTSWTTNAILDWDGVEFTYIGTNSDPKYAVRLTTTGAGAQADITDCSFYYTNGWALYLMIDIAVTSKFRIQRLSVSQASRVASGGAIYVIGQTANPNNADRLIEDVCIIGCGLVGASNYGIQMGSASNTGDLRFPIRNICISGVTSSGNGAFYMDLRGNTPSDSWTRPVVNTWNNWTAHSNGYHGIMANNRFYSTRIDTIKSYRNNSGLYINCSLPDMAIYSYISNFEFFGNNYGIYATSTLTGCVFTNGSINGDTTYSCPSGFYSSSINEVMVNCEFYNVNFSVVSGIKTACTRDFWHFLALSNPPMSATAKFYNCIIDLERNMPVGTWTGDGRYATDKYSLAFSDLNAPNIFRTYAITGLVESDSVIVRPGTVRSVRMTPKFTNTARFPPWITKHPGDTKRVAVRAGQTFDISVYVRESVVGDGTDYTGSRIRLMARRNDRMGYLSDTLLDEATIASVGAFELLSATTVAALQDGLFEFYIDCDGNVGWINVQDWAVT